MVSKCTRGPHGGTGNTAKKVIRAAVEAAEGREGATPPPELRLYWLCKRYTALPEPGALFEQDAGLLSRMATLGNIYETMQRIRGLKGEAIHNMRPDDGRVWAWVDEMLAGDD